MTTAIPQLSILVPTYNRRTLLLETLTSILTQSYTEFEVIVSDNCSTDGTQEAVKELRDDRIVYVRNESNIGPANNHNKALRNARGKYIYFFSDDDIMLPNNLQRKIDVFEQHPSVGLVHSNINIIGSDGQITAHGHWVGRYPPHAAIYQTMRNSPLMKQATAFHLLYYEWIFLSMPTVMVRASLIRDNQLELNNQLKYMYDWDLWLKLSLKTDFYYLDEILVHYRLHASNDSRAYTSEVYFRELALCKLGTINLFNLYHLHGRNYLSDVQAQVKQQLKAVKFYENYVQEQMRHFRGYLKQRLSPDVIERLKKIRK